MHKILRSSSSGLLLNLTAVAAHHIGGGDFLTSNALFLSLAISVALSAFASFSPLEGPNLAMLILANQLIAHIYLGLNSGNSFAMIANHLISGLICYFTISYLDQAILWIRNCLLTISPTRFRIPSIEGTRALPRLSGPHSLIGRFSAFQYWTTSPPLVVGHP